MPTLTPTKRIILITGASQGLGLSTMRLLTSREPSNIYLLGARDIAKGNRAIEKLREWGIDKETVIEVCKLDVTRDEDIEDVVRHVNEKWGRLDVLINNAGIAPNTTLTENSSPASLREAYTHLLSTNLISLFILTSALLPLLRKAARPKVVNITSGLASLSGGLAGVRRFPGSTEYGSSKTGVNGLTVHMQRDEDASSSPSVTGKIKFYAAQPGFLKTAFTRFNERGLDPDVGAEVIARLAVDEQDGKEYAGGRCWKVNDAGEMEEAPW